MLWVLLSQTYLTCDKTHVSWVCTYVCFAVPEADVLADQISVADWPKHAKCLFLSAGYLMQYTPSLGMLVMKMIGPGRAAQMKGGSSGYDVKSMLFGKSNGKNE